MNSGRGPFDPLEGNIRARYIGTLQGRRITLTKKERELKWVDLLKSKYSSPDLDKCPFQRHTSGWIGMVFLGGYLKGILSFLLFLYTFRIQKCPETGKRQNPLKKSLFQGILSFLLFLDTFRIQGIFVVSPVSRHFWKMLQGSRGFVISPVIRHFHRAERRRREVRRV